jgi:hypothetical protein
VITGYVGLIGQGKTMLATVEAVTLARRRNAILASNILVSAPGVDVHRLSVGDDGLEGVPELLARSKAEGRGVVVLADELGIITPARFWQQGMSIDLMWSMSQSRKLGGDMIFTAQNIAQVDSFLRKLTQYVTRVRAVPAPSIERRERGKRPWLYITQRFQPEDADDHRPEKRLARGVVRYRREWEAWYDTDELVHPPSFLRGRRPRSEARSAGGRGRAPEGPERSGGGRVAALHAAP